MDPSLPETRLKHAARTVALRTRTYDAGKGALDVVWRQRQRRAGTYSQFAEDRVVLDLLGPNGTYIDIGANHPYKSNNTYLLYRAGWHGLTIEPIKSHGAHHRRLRPRDTCLTAAAGCEQDARRFHELNPSGFSTFDEAAAAALCESRQAILVNSYEVAIVRTTDAWNEHFPSESVDFIAIDTEGFELAVLDGIDFDALRPQLVLVEFERPTAPNHADDIIAKMRSVGYDLHSSHGVNGLFARD